MKSKLILQLPPKGGNTKKFREQFSFEIGIKLVSRNNGTAGWSTFHGSGTDYLYFIGSKAEITKIKPATYDKSRSDIFVQFEKESIEVVGTNNPIILNCNTYEFLSCFFVVQNNNLKKSTE